MNDNRIERNKNGRTILNKNCGRHRRFLDGKIVEVVRSRNAANADKHDQRNITPGWNQVMRICQEKIAEEQEAGNGDTRLNDDEGIKTNIEQVLHHGGNAAPTDRGNGNQEISLPTLHAEVGSPDSSAFNL